MATNTAGENVYNYAMLWEAMLTTMIENEVDTQPL
jgi:hypothetical protein